jgi:hypothetical protein
MDYDSGDQRRHMIKTSKEALKKGYNFLEIGQFFRFPEPTNPINSVGNALSVHFYQKWVEYWLGTGREGGQHCGVANMEQAPYNPLCKMGGATCHFTWTYDLEITFTTV